MGKKSKAKKKASRQPVNQQEWLLDKIRYNSNIEDLRNIALILCLTLDDLEVIDQYFGNELGDDGFYDNYEEEPYDDGSSWLGEDKEAFDIATGFLIDKIRSRRRK